MQILLVVEILKLLCYRNPGLFIKPKEPLPVDITIKYFMKFLKGSL